VTPREVQQGVWSLKAPGAAEAALSALAAAGMGEWIDSPTTARGGRPTRVFRLHPTSTSTEPKESPVFGGSVDVDAVDEAHHAPDSDDWGAI
jgi:hypothetical protein